MSQYTDAAMEVANSIEELLPLVFVGLIALEAIGLTYLWLVGGFSPLSWRST